MACIHAGFKRPPPQIPTYIYKLISKIYIYVCIAGHLSFVRLPWRFSKNVGILGDNTPNASIYAGFQRPDSQDHFEKWWTTS
jgi:hypothetical protein